MPRHDPVPRVLRSLKREPLYLKVVRAVRRKPKSGKDDGGLPMTVEPNRPNNLSGGAAAALEFDD